MKKILLFLSFLFSVSFLFAQHPVGTDSLALQTVGNSNTLFKSKGAIGSDSGFVVANFPDTVSANRSKISHYPGALIRTGNTLWQRDETATHWLLAGTQISNVTIINDSSFQVCNVNGCDTFYTTVVAQLVTIVNDTTIRICDTVNNCQDFIFHNTNFISCARCYDSLRVINDSTLRFYTQAGDSDQVDFEIIPLDLSNYVTFGDVPSLIDYLNHKVDSIRISEGPYFDTLWQYKNNGTDSSIVGLLYKNLGDGLIRTGGIYLVDSTLSILPNIIYRIGGTVYTVSSQQDFTINSSTDGTCRKDLIYADTLGVLTLLQGTEDASIAVAPDVPEGTIPVTIVDVCGDVIQSIPQPIYLTSGVDSIWRVPGIDSIFFKISGRTHKILDSTGGAGADGSETIVTAGTNVTVTGTGTSGDPYVVNSSDSVGGGSVPALIPKPVLFGRSDSTIQQDTSIAVDSILSASSTKLGKRFLRVGTIVQEPNYGGKKIVFMGNSITGGLPFGTLASNASSEYYQYSRVATRLLSGWGLIEYNLGTQGSTFATGIGIIPVKDGTMQFLSASYGINEVDGVPVTKDHAGFVADIKAFLDTAIARGWAAKDILLCSISGTNIGYLGLTTKQRDFNAVIDSFHNVYGTMFAECYESMQIPEYDYITKGQLHPDDYGHEFLGYAVAGAIRGNFNIVNHGLAVSDTMQIANLIYKNQHFVTKGHLLALDSLGNVGVTHTLEPNIATQGRLWLNGAVIQRGSLLPTTYDTVGDFIMKAGNSMLSVAGGTGGAKKTIFQLTAPVSSTTTLWNQASNGAINFTVSGGSDGGSLNAIAIPAASGIPSFPNGLSMATGKTLATGNASLLLFNTSRQAEWYNPGSDGTTMISMSNGTTNGYGKMFQMDAFGKVIMQQHGTYPDLPLSRFSVNSTTGGVLWPRMTTTQRDALVSVVSGAIDNAGSGQTTGTYDVILSGGGSGTGATARATVSGGIATSVTMVTGGNNYSGTVTGTISAGGTPATFTFTLGTTTGLMIYNTTTNTYQYYNGTAWTDFSSGFGNQSAYTLYGNNTGSSAAPTFFTNNYSDSLRRSADSIYRRVNGQWIFQYKDSSSAGSPAWATNGNSITAGTDFLGTTNNTSLRFRTNNTAKAVLDSNGRFGLGIASPLVPFHYQGTANSTIIDAMRLFNTGSGGNTGTRLAMGINTSNYSAVTGYFSASTQTLGFEINGTETANFTSSAFNFGTGAVARTFTYNNGGGTSNTSGMKLVMGGSGGFYIFSPANDKLNIGSSSNSFWSASNTAATASNTFTSGVGSATQIPVAIQGASTSQTANLTEWRNSGGTALSAVDSIGEIGAGTSTPTSTLQVNGSFSAAINATAKTSAYTATRTDHTIRADGTSGAFNVTLPTAVGIQGRIYVIKKTDASGNAVTVATTSSQTIDGSTTYSLAAQYKYVVVQSNNANWEIIGNN